MMLVRRAFTLVELPAVSKCKRAAFTLVELLVVIGIIAVLVAILLPVLGRAREHANRVKCLATLRTMAQAAHLHANDHAGYMPVAGLQSPRHLGVSATPEGLQDAARKKYMYYQASHSVTRPVPLTAALAYYMNVPDPMGRFETSPGDVSRDVDRQAVRQHFTCASQDPDTMPKGAVLSENASVVFPEVRMSYIFNGTVLGRVISDTWGETPAGKLSCIRRPSIVFLFADGNPADYSMGYSINAAYTMREALFYHYLTSRNRFDPHRHRGKLNVVFVDGHAETVQMPTPDREGDPPYYPGDFERVGVSLGIFD